MSWLTITLFAYFLNAIAIVVDKTLLRREIKNPFVYTFYIAALGVALIILALPFAYLFRFNLIWPGISQLSISLLAGGAFSLGLFLMFIALVKTDVSTLTPMVGGLTPIFVIILAFLFLGENLSALQLLGVSAVLVGTFLISLEYGGNRRVLFKKILLLALPSALFFGISYVLTKDVYNHQPFISGFIWTRLGALIVALIPMLWPKNLRAVLHPSKNEGLNKAKSRFLFGQACGGASAVLLQYAISIASVSLIQAMQGSQYVFVFLIALIITLRYPALLRENFSRIVIIQKTLGIVFIALGVFFII